MTMDLPVAPERATHYSEGKGNTCAAFWNMVNGRAIEAWAVRPGGVLWHTEHPPIQPTLETELIPVARLAGVRPALTQTIYLSGPMSGLPDSNYPAFNAEAARLRALGYQVENPAENGPPACGTWQGYMRTAVAQLVRCDLVALLPGWSESRGALIERQLAVTLGMPTVQSARIQRN